MTKFVLVGAAAAAVTFGSAINGVAQAAGQGGAQGTAQQAAPAAPSPRIPLPIGGVPQGAAAMRAFPTPNPKNFTATSPTKDEVDSFLKSLWGYDPNRTWQVSAILKTPAPGVSKIVVAVADKAQPGKIASTVFFTTPDGQHAIAENVIDFGAKPFAANRALLQAQADGPARGASGKELLLVEFGDLQCPRCREAQETVDKLAQDFPQARVVFENFPLQEVHPFAMQAALEGECVRRSKGDAGFFTYAQAVYDTQPGLTPEGAQATLSAAVSKAGADPAAVSACAATPAAKDAIAAQMKLGSSLGVDQTPILAVNGHLLAPGSMPYDVLKRIVIFQGTQDGVAVQVQPSLTTLK